MRMHRDERDEQLAAAAQRGDASAYDALVRRYLRGAMALAWQYTRDVHDAEDVVQDAFHKAVRALPGYDPSRPFGPWFWAIVRNTARSAIGRDARRAALAPLALLEAEPEAQAVSDPVVAGDLGRALEMLAPMQRAVFQLCEVEGFTSLEAGAMLGIAEGTSRTHLHRARQALRAHIGEAKVGCSDG